MIAFITGATAGFGAAIARRYVREGHEVVATGRRLDRLEALRGELGAACHIVELDVRDRTAVQQAFAALPAAFRDVDVLVNNAGLAMGLEPAQAANLDDWDTMVDTNVKGLMYCTRAALPGMVARNRGHVVNLGSVAAMYPYPGGNVYGASKAFVHQFSLNLRADLLGTAVRVTDIQPGMCAGTEFSSVRFRGDDARAAKVYEGVPGPLTAEDIADTVCWVTSRPAHININALELMPVAQAFNAFKVDRRS
ncbi:MAG TPA: SDR family NAD(P)-dependent oxidoreductase [Usitatibacter sp.]|jgi:3-hydroxy acid dehydrogenase/malonic semialdehyde reductase|nr:SDR family NAD(P)-dependent oxidoreductase [Usitatibacter sp.]